MIKNTCLLWGITFAFAGSNCMLNARQLQSRERSQQKTVGTGLKADQQKGSNHQMSMAGAFPIFLGVRGLKKIIFHLFKEPS